MKKKPKKVVKQAETAARSYRLPVWMIDELQYLSQKNHRSCAGELVAAWEVYMKGTPQC